MDHLFEQKLVRENQQLQLELTKLNKQIKQLQEKVVGYEQVLSQLNEGEKRNIRIADSLARKQNITRVGREKLKAISSYIDNAKSKGNVAGTAAAKALEPKKAAVEQGVAAAEIAGKNLKAALDVGTAKVTRSREARLARGTFSDKPSEQAQADRIAVLGGDFTGGRNLYTSSQRLAQAGKLPAKVEASIGRKLRLHWSVARSE